MSEEKLPVFVYGTLRLGERNWYRYLHGRTLKQIEATLPKHKLYVQVYPFVTDASDGSQVLGELVYLPEREYDEVLQDLDGLEKYDAATNTGWYLRVVREVEYYESIADHEHLCRVRAWVYHPGPEVASELTEADWIEHGDWLLIEDRVEE
jgi:gamma-glutamylcyclotransferase (GGCT)/AIG2-like uncharacterized protein YtfP